MFGDILSNVMYNSCLLRYESYILLQDVNKNIVSNQVHEGSYQRFSDKRHEDIVANILGR